MHAFELYLVSTTCLLAAGFVVGSFHFRGVRKFIVFLKLHRGFLFCGVLSLVVLGLSMSLMYSFLYPAGLEHGG